MIILNMGYVSGILIRHEGYIPAIANLRGVLWAEGGSGYVGLCR
jgi:hypothetical protein